MHIGNIGAIASTIFSKTDFLMGIQPKQQLRVTEEWQDQIYQDVWELIGFRKNKEIRIIQEMNNMK